MHAAVSASGVLINILFDELQQHRGHIQVLHSGRGLEAVVQVDGNIQIHSFYP